jgi:hypothetical protein
MTRSALHAEPNRRDLLKGLSAGVAAAALGGLSPAFAQSNPYAGLKGEPLELLIWDGGAFVDNMMASVQAKWSAVGGGTLKFRKVPFGDLDRAVRSANQGGAGPDVFLANAPNVITYKKLGLIEPVTDMFSKEDLEDFFPTVRLGSEIDGEFYGPSTNENGQALYYDRQLTDRYGIKLPETLADAWTWDEWLRVFKEIQAGERKRRGNDQFFCALSEHGQYRPVLLRHFSTQRRREGLECLEDGQRRRAEEQRLSEFFGSAAGPAAHSGHSPQTCHRAGFHPEGHVLQRSGRLFLRRAALSGADQKGPAGYRSRHSTCSLYQDADHPYRLLRLAGQSPDGEDGRCETLREVHGLARRQ